MTIDFLKQKIKIDNLGIFHRKFDEKCFLNEKNSFRCRITTLCMKGLTLGRLRCDQIDYTSIKGNT